MDARRQDLITSHQREKRVQFIGLTIWMKNIKDSKFLKKCKKPFLWIICWIYGFYILFFAIPDFITYALNDFHIDSIDMEICMDHGGYWDDDLRECEYAPEGTLSYPYACLEAGLKWRKGVGCLYTKDYAAQFPEIEPYED